MFAFSAWSDLKEFRQRSPIKYMHGLVGFYATEKNQGFCCLESSNNFRNTLLRGIRRLQGSACENKTTSPCSTFPEEPFNPTQKLLIKLGIRSWNSLLY
jgi:hypothetical protein